MRSWGRFVSSLFTSIILLGVFSVTAGAPAAAVDADIVWLAEEDPSASVSAFVSFRRPVSFAEALDATRSVGIEQLFHAFRGQQSASVGGYLLAPGEPLADALTRYALAQEDMLVEAIAKARAGAVAGPEPDASAWQAMWSDLADRLETLRLNGPTVYGVQVRGTSAEINAIAAGPARDLIRVIQRASEWTRAPLLPWEEPS
jgi:hypothetical protein